MATTARFSDDESALREAFLLHTRGEYDEKLDERIKKQGEKILKENNPYKKSGWINTHMIFWMMAAMAVFYFTDFYVALRVDTRIHRLWLNIGFVLVAINIGIGMFFVFWCSYYKKNKDWERIWPAGIPIATASFIAGMICLMYALWPVWGFLTPFILFTLFMGLIFLTTLLPI